MGRPLPKHPRREWQKKQLRKGRKQQHKGEKKDKTESWFDSSGGPDGLAGKGAKRLVERDTQSGYGRISEMGMVCGDAAPWKEERRDQKNVQGAHYNQNRGGSCKNNVTVRKRKGKMKSRNQSTKGCDLEVTK